MLDMLCGTKQGIRKMGGVQGRMLGNDSLQTPGSCNYISSNSNYTNSSSSSNVNFNERSIRKMDSPYTQRPCLMKGSTNTSSMLRHRPLQMAIANLQIFRFSIGRIRLNLRRPAISWMVFILWFRQTSQRRNLQ